MKRKRGFTLLELVVVIIIIAILASLGFTQYTKILEMGRGTEAMMILSQIRTFAHVYRLENATIDGIQDSGVGIGTAPDQIPKNCLPSHYFAYWLNTGSIADPVIGVYVQRCSTGGKPPQVVCPNPCRYYWQYNLVTGWTRCYLDLTEGDPCCPDYRFKTE